MGCRREVRTSILANEGAGIVAKINDPKKSNFFGNAHNSHFSDGLGVQNVYLGEYARVDGKGVFGPSLSDLVSAVSSHHIIHRFENLLESTENLKTATEAN